MICVLLIFCSRRPELNPEKLLIDKEHNWDLKSRLKEVLSTFEQQVLTYYLEGMDYTALQKKNAEAAEVS